MDFASARRKKGRFLETSIEVFPANSVTLPTSFVIMVFENFFHTRVQRSDKLVERCILTEIIAQDCCTLLTLLPVWSLGEEARSGLGEGVGGHSALSAGEDTGPVAHKAAVIFYNVTRQNPWQEGGARRAVGRRYRANQCFQEQKIGLTLPAPIDRPRIMKLLWDQARGQLLSSDWPRISFGKRIS